MELPCSRCGRTNPPSCQNNKCPYFVHPKRKTLKKDFFGQAPNLFVGRHGYPDVRVGLLATEDEENTDDPKKWLEEDTSISEIVDLRSSLVNSQFLANVKNSKDRLLKTTQLVAQGKDPADMEINLDKTPSFSTQYPQGTKPHGANAQLKKAALTENVRIPRAVDKLVNDDLKAADQLAKLREKDVDEYALAKLLTAGVLGFETTKKLVPTRWGITAVDDTLGKELLTHVKRLPVHADIDAYFGGRYGNYFCVLIFNHHFQFELFEIATGSRSNTKATTDYESFKGRTKYAEECAGGYYAARIAALEKLKELKRQASVLAIRFITDEYTNPLGVWVVREAVREALDSKPISFATRELAIRYAQAQCKKYDVDWKKVIEPRTKLLPALNQRSLDSF